MNATSMENPLNVQQYNLRWTNFTCNLLEKFAEHLNREALTDVSLVCEGTVIHAHRIILSASSVYFQNLFELHKVAHPMIIFNGVKLEDLQQVIAFIYQGEIKVGEEDIQRILKLATDFDIKGLSNITYRNIVEQKLNEENFGKREPINSTQSTPNQTSVNQNNVPVLNNHNGTDSKDVLSRLTESMPGSTELNVGDKIVRPPNAFMLFTTEWRTKLAEKYPNDNNKEISVRLGTMWKKLPHQQKTRYYYLARKMDTAKQIKHYSTEEAKRRKEQRHKQQEESRLDIKQEVDDSSRDSSSDKLEIVEDEVELIEINDDADTPEKKPDAIEDSKDTL